MNKPVAWIAIGDNTSVFFDLDTALSIDDNPTPLYTHPVKEPDFTVEKDSQDWKGMDGATAFWLIERHSNHWDDARLMMEEWLKANTHPVKELTDEEIECIRSQCGIELVDGTWRIDEQKFARAILRKAQSHE